MTKHYFMALAAISTLTFTSCGYNVENTAKGVILDATMNTITITDSQSGDTLSFSTMNSEKIAADGILLGDTAQLFYKGALTNETVATKVIVTPAALSPLLGAWVEPIPGIGGEQGILFEKGGIASSINMYTLVYKSWQQNGDTLTLTGESIGNGQTIDFTEKAVIEKLDIDSLVIAFDGNRIIRYSKQQ